MDDDAWVAGFLRDGFVKVAGAFDEALARECARLLWEHTVERPDGAYSPVERAIRRGLETGHTGGGVAAAGPAVR